jgi:hypothetical protein
MSGLNMHEPVNSFGFIIETDFILRNAPFVKRKSVVHKSELDDCQFIDRQQFYSD